MSFFHGVRTSESPTSIVPAAPCEAVVPVYFGTAPVYYISGGNNVNVPVLCNSYSEAVSRLGYRDDWSRWTLCENMFAQFSLFAMSPCIFVNVFDPTVHKDSVTDEVMTLVNGRGVTAHDEAYLNNFIAKDSTGEVVYTRDVDYALSRSSTNGAITLRVLSGGAISSDAIALKVSYSYADPGAVSSSDIIGGIDALTGNATGLEVLESVYPLTRKVPGLVVATGWSHASTVAAVMAAKASNINGVFKALAVIDIASKREGAPKVYSDVPAYKEQMNMTNALQHLLWPRLSLGGADFRFSSQFAPLVQWTTHHKGNDIPYVSPSNQNLKCDKLLVGTSSEVAMSLAQANYLNENGITTALNFSKGWTAWGNRNACYPGSTDTKDTLITNRLMFNWLQAEFVLTFWQKVDGPITRRLIESVVDSFNDRLNGLVAQEALLGGRIEFRKEDNPVSNLIDGKIKFKLFITPPPPAEVIEGDFEIDPDYFDVLFSD